MKEERGASLGEEEERLKKLTPARITRSKMKTMLARFECVLADDGPRLLGYHRARFGLDDDVITTICTVTLPGKRL